MASLNMYTDLIPLMIAAFAIAVSPLIVGRRWNPMTLDFFTASTIIGGPALTRFLTDNLGGPTRSTIARRRSTKFVLKPGICEENFKHVAEHFEDVGGGIAWETSMDETVVLASLHMSSCGRFLFGSCGPRSRPDSPHKCAIDFCVEVPDGPDGYKVLEQAFDTLTCAHCK